MVRPVAGDLPEQVKNNQSVNTAAGNGGQKMSQYSWFTVYGRVTIGGFLYPYPLHSFPTAEEYHRQHPGKVWGAGCGLRGQ